MTRTYRINITRTDRDALPSGAAIGFGFLATAADQQQAEQIAADRLARCHDAAMLFVESVQDVTP